MTGQDPLPQRPGSPGPGEPAGQDPSPQQPGSPGPGNPAGQDPIPQQPGSPGPGEPGGQDPGGPYDPGTSPDVLRAEHIRKQFGPVTALHDVTLHVARGEVLGLIGDNGAGKSTLLKIICGFQQPDSGRILLNGQPVQLKSVVHARSLGIDVVYQDLALINELSVYHNMFLNRERTTGPLLSNGTMRRIAQEHLSEMGVHIPSVNVPVARLSGGQRQAIAVARAVFTNAKVLLLDEPLAAMGAKEGAMILDLVQDLKRRGDVSVIIIAHNYGQVLEVCDRVNLLQHGEIVLDKYASETSAAELTDMVVAEYRKALAERHGAA
jgi:simple sugar transport system ATP-binding protein